MMSVISSAIQPVIQGAIGSVFSSLGLEISPEKVIADMFAAGAKGAWYERSQSNLLYQNPGGVDIAAVGSTVGLGLSRDQASALGQELHVPNTASPAWNAGLGRWVMSRSAAGALVSYTTNVTLVPGQLYKVEFDGFPDGGAFPHVTELRASAGGLSLPGALQVTLSSQGQRVTGYVLASTGAGLLSFWGGTANNGNVWGAANISVRQALGNHQIQATLGARPLYQVAPQRLVFDGIDDLLTTSFPAALGAACTVGRSVPGTGAVITAGVNIGTSFADNMTASALLIADRALTAGEAAAWTTYLNQQLTK